MFVHSRGFLMQLIESHGSNFCLKSAVALLEGATTRSSKCVQHMNEEADFVSICDIL